MAALGAPGEAPVFSGARVVRVALGLALLGWVGVVAGFLLERRQTYFAYLTAFSFATSVALGALIFLMVSYVVGAKWSVVIRRINESIVSVLPLLGLLFVPIAFGLPDLYYWADPTSELPAAAARLLHHRQAYLNPPFFVLRALGYFVIWSAAAVLLCRWSLRRDRAFTGNPAAATSEESPEPPGVDEPEAPHARERAFSAALLPPVCLALTFAGFDWLMSLQSGYSSLFGVYYFAGGFQASFGLLSLLAFLAQRHVPSFIRPPHFHALGRLMFGFSIFWAYCAFFQGMLTQIANKPDEVVFFLPRTSGGWGFVTLLLVLGRFALPFLLLLPRAIKFNAAAMAVMGAWILLGQYLDMFWLVEPAAASEGPRLGLLELSALAAIGGVCVAFAAFRLRGNTLVPVGDPTLSQSIAYRSPT
jgi:hypothetical protein